MTDYVREGSRVLESYHDDGPVVFVYVRWGKDTVLVISSDPYDGETVEVRPIEAMRKAFDGPPHLEFAKVFWAWWESVKNDPAPKW